MKLQAKGIVQTYSEKLMILLWLLIPVVMLVVSVYGWSIGDLRGGFLVSFLPASVFTIIATAMALFIQSPFSRLARWIWLAVNVTALLAAIIYANREMPDALKGADMILTYVMLILSFPAALLVPSILMIITPLVENGTNLGGLCVLWAAFLLGGYLQWFMLYPWLWCKWKARRTGMTTSPL